MKVTVNHSQNQIIIEAPMEVSVQDDVTGLYVGMDVNELEFTVEDIQQLLDALTK